MRAVAYTQTVAKQPSGAEGVRLTEHILNNFDIPKGWIQTGDDSKVPLEFTQWSTIADLKNQKYYVRVRTYKKAGNSKFYSGWSKTKSVKTK